MNKLKNDNNKKNDESSSKESEDEPIITNWEACKKRQPPCRMSVGSKKTDSSVITKTMDKSEEKSKKIPLLDQSLIVEGSRTRKSVVQLKPNAPPSKYPPISIPNGTGTPLGKIFTINARFECLRYDIMKDFHRKLYGRIGDVKLLKSNIGKFQGFPFSKDSNEYTRKLNEFLKLPYNHLRELMYFLDLDVKNIKGKAIVAENILNFLLKPQQSDTEYNPPPLRHPKRKATKRQYIEADIEEKVKKKKKKPVENRKTDDENEDLEGNKENNVHKEKSPSKSLKSKEKSNSKKNQQNEAKEDKNSEYKKPAKKRKQNQVMNDVENENESTKKIKNKKKEEKNNKETDNDDSDKIPDDNSKELSDEELKKFLEKVLKNANLEETTMKTVYSLISSNFPSYDFSKKKDFIKNVVKSFIQS